MGELVEVVTASDKELQVALEVHRTVSAGLCLPDPSEVVRSRTTLDGWDRRQRRALADDYARLGTAAAIVALAQYPDLRGEDAGREWLTRDRASLAPVASLLREGPANSSSRPLSCQRGRALAGGRDLRGGGPAAEIHWRARYRAIES